MISQCVNQMSNEIVEDSTTVSNDDITKHRNMYKNNPVQNTSDKGEVE